MKTDWSENESRLWAPRSSAVRWVNVRRWSGWWHRERNKNPHSTPAHSRVESHRFVSHFTSPSADINVETSWATVRIKKPACDNNKQPLTPESCDLSPTNLLLQKENSRNFRCNSAHVALRLILQYCRKVQVTPKPNNLDLFLGFLR